MCFNNDCAVKVLRGGYSALLYYSLNFQGLRYVYGMSQFRGHVIYHGKCMFCATKEAESSLIQRAAEPRLDIKKGAARQESESNL